MITTINNKHKKLNFSNEREQSQAYLNSAEHEKNQGRKVLNVPNLRFKEFEGEWDKCELGEVATIIGGYAFKSETLNSIGGKYQVVKMGNLYQNQLDLHRSPSYTDTLTHKAENVILQKDDIAITLTGTNNKRDFGYTYMFNDEKNLLLNQRCGLIRAKGNPYFLSCLLKTHTFLNQFFESATGGTGNQANVSTKAMEMFSVNTPSLKEQEKIGQLMALLDERIATQNKIIEDLKRLKSAIIEIEYTPNTKTTSHIGDVIEQISKRNKNNAIKNVLSVSNRQGFIKQSDQFENRNVASEDTSNYKIVEKNDFAFNPARINVGSIARLTTFEKGIVSPMYICFRTQENVAPEYIDYFFESKHFYCEIQKRLEGSVRQCLSFEGLCNIPLSLPSFEMQQRIGKRLFTLGQKIKTETDLLELLNKQKQYLLRQMFI